MAVSLIQRRMAPLRGWHPFGPMGTPPARESLPEEYDQEGVVLVGGKLHRSFSWPGFAPFCPDSDPDSSSPAEQEQEGPAAEAQRVVTTYMVLKLERCLSRNGFAKTLDRLGFRGLYDYIYLPLVLGSGKNQGYAFVNFLDEKAAQFFERSLADPGTRRAHGVKWRAVPADVQGSRANHGVARSEKVSRIRKCAAKPLVIPQGARGAPADAGFEGGQPRPVF